MDDVDEVGRNPFWFNALARDAARWRALNDAVEVASWIAKARKWDDLGLPDDTDPADAKKILTAGSAFILEADAMKKGEILSILGAKDDTVALARYIEEQGT